MTRARDIADRNVDSTTIDGVDSTQLLRSDAADTKTAGDLSFADSVKAVFGAGSDLQIYHDGSNSYIDDAGTGNLLIRGAGTGIYIQKYTGESMINAIADGAVQLLHDNVVKLATTSSGVSITGTTEASVFKVASGQYFDTSGGNVRINNINNADILFRTGSSGNEHMRLTSAGRLGIGTTSPDTVLHAKGSITVATIESTAANGDIRLKGSGTSGYTAVRSNAETLQFLTEATERMRLSGGNLGIGTSSPTAGFRTSIKGDYSSVVGGIEFDSGGGDKFTVGFVNATSPSAKLNVVGAGHLIMATDNTERMRITHTTGKVGIGTSIPDTARLHIVSADTHQLKLQSSSGDITRFQGDSFVVTRNGDFFFDNRNQSTNNFQYRCGSSAAHIFSCGTSEKARVNTQSIIVGKTSNGSLSDVGCELNTSGYGMFTRSTGTVLFLKRADTGSTINFYSGSSNVGNISVTSSNTVFNTSSDRRLKSNIQDAKSASDKIDAIQVRQFDWNVDGHHQDYGLIAQELQPIEPMAVSGDADSDEMMSVDYSKLVPMLLKEIQSLRGRVAALEAA